MMECMLQTYISHLSCQVAILSSFLHCHDREFYGSYCQGFFGKSLIDMKFDNNWEIYAHAR